MIDSVRKREIIEALRKEYQDVIDSDAWAFGEAIAGLTDEEIEFAENLEIYVEVS